MHAMIAVIPILTFQFEECRFTALREATVEAVDVARVQVIAGAGTLRIEGKPGLRQARIRGTACASDKALLEDIELTTRRDGNDLVVFANDRDLELRNREYARLNVVIEVPEFIAAAIADSSGDIELAGLGSVDVKDGSGDISARGIRGNVTIEDNSGSIKLSDVNGDVSVEDGTGEIQLADVAGAVDIRDGSGSILLQRVSRSAAITDGSGDIDVDGVGGNLTVRSDGSGDIDYRAVRGTIRLPANGRDYHKSRLRLFR